MKLSKLFFKTSRETPKEANLISHQLMLRAGLIDKLSSGLYNWLPLGYRVLRKIETIVRDEMDKSGANELLMSMFHPKELWLQTNRWQEYGKELLRVSDRHNNEFCVCPTAEEVITDLVKRNIKSYKNLPLNLYQIHSKFRDEIRPRFGVMRAREFVMKDAYSFHIDSDSLQETYQLMYHTYCNIFDRIGLEYKAVQADSGSIGGDSSHEFHVIADSGEDKIAFSTISDYAVNVELAETLRTTATTSKAERLPQKKVKTPIIKSCIDLENYGFSMQNSVKTLMIKTITNSDIKFYGLILRCDHTLNEVKVRKALNIQENQIHFLNDKELGALNLQANFIGPIKNLEEKDIKFYADFATEQLVNFGCGANESSYHYKNFNWGTDIAASPIFIDIRNITANDPSPDGKGKIEIKCGIEVGHIFKLGRKYSKAMNLTIQNKNGDNTILNMGCYGIGITRIIAASIEQNHDEKGIIWPEAICPYHIILVPINYKKSEKVCQIADKLYYDLSQHNLEVLLDDRGERLGVMLNDADLIGIPHRVVIGEKTLVNNQVEYKKRNQQKSEFLTPSELIERLLKINNGGRIRAN